MKKILLLLMLLILISGLKALIVINKTNMPVPGDTIRLRTAYSVNSIDYTLTGTNYIWDFSSLVYSNTVIDTFVSVLSTPLLYNVAFSDPFDQAHLATVAFKQTQQNLPILQISNGYAFMKNSTSQYAQVGVGIEISSVAVPMTFSNPEILYRFPITFNTHDSSDASYHASIPSFGYYGEKRHRVNFVDGWGTLYLPGDTFNVIRVKSVVTYTDTVYVNAVSFGFSFPRTETEYKWLTTGHHEPVLQITKQNNFASAKFFTNMPSSFGINAQSAGADIKIFPDPVSDILHISLNGNAVATEVSVLDITGKVVFNKYFDNAKSIDILVANLSKGIYFYRIQNPKQNINGKFLKE
jgi:hypothetical protein